MEARQAGDSTLSLSTLGFGTWQFGSAGADDYWGLEFTDELALGCVAALEDRDIRVPEEVAVTGFDDLPTLATGLTTVRQDIAAIAAMSVELLSEALAGKAPRHVSLPVALVLRETS